MREDGRYLGRKLLAQRARLELMRRGVCRKELGVRE